MKIKNILLILSFFICFQVASYGDVISKPSPTLKWKPTSASSISSKANRDPAYGTQSSGAMSDPFVGGMMNGYYNMMKGSMGSAYEFQEMQKQQVDYAKQQTQQVQSTED